MIGAVKANVHFNNVVLEDKRPALGEAGNGQRIVRLLESKVGEKRADMIRVVYSKNDMAQEDVNISISS